MAKKDKPKAEGIPAGVEQEVNNALDSKASEQIVEKAKRTIIKSDLSKEEMMKLRIKMFGERKAKLGAFMYRMASMAKKDAPDTLSRLYKRSKPDGKTENPIVGGMHIFDSFLKFQANKKDDEGNITPMLGKFFRLPEDSPAYIRIKDAGNKALVEMQKDGKIGIAVKNFLLISGVIATAASKRTSTGAKTTKGGSKFLDDIKGWDAF